MDLAVLQCFEAVASHQSFSAAAKTMNTNQSTLSRQIQSLENTFGVRLFDRIGRGISLTPAGEELLGLARLLLQDAKLLALRADELARGRRANLRTGATPQTIESFLSPLLADFAKLEPEVEFSLSEGNSEDLLHRVEQGEVHIAITSPPQPPLTGIPLYPLVPLAVVPRHNPLSRQRSVEVSDLAGEQLIVFSKGYMTRRLLDGAAALEGFRPRILLESRNSHILLRLAKDGLGIAIAPSTLDLTGIDQAILPLLHRGEPLSLWMSVVWDSRRTLPPVANKFIERAIAFSQSSYPGRDIPIVQRLITHKLKEPPPATTRIEDQ